MDQRNTLIDIETQIFFWERYMSQGKEAFYKDRISDALHLFSLAQTAGSCLKDRDREARTLSWISLAFYEQKNFAKAEKAFDRAIDLFGANIPALLEDSQHYLLLAMRYERQGLTQQAEEAYTRMRELQHDLNAPKKRSSKRKTETTNAAPPADVKEKAGAAEPTLKATPIPPPPKAPAPKKRDVTFWDFANPN